MSKANHVPKFGNWDANDQVPFTVVFEKARADHKGGTGTGNKMMNPNDPSENPAAFGVKSSEGPPPSRRPVQQRYNADESDQRSNSARAEHSKKGSHGGVRDSEGVGFGEGHYSEHSPSHPSSPFRGRLGNRPAVPSTLGPDKKGPREDGTPHHHPARTRFRPGSREDMLPERGSALPKFGAWDEKDPSSGDGFTLIFNHARQEKIIGGPARIPAHQSDSPITMDHDDAYKPPHQPFHRKASSWACCFRT